MSRKFVSFVKLYNRVHSKRTLENMFAQQRSDNAKRLRKKILKKINKFFLIH